MKYKDKNCGNCKFGSNYFIKNELSGIYCSELDMVIKLRFSSIKHTRCELWKIKNLTREEFEALFDNGSGTDDDGIMGTTIV